MAATQKHPAELFANVHLEHKLLLPHDEGYTQRQDSFWSSYSRSEPACIVRPISATEVATIVKTLKTAGQQFAVRSGGHTQWEGANNIQDGVTIDLQFLNGVKLDEATETVDIGPGARWKEVYDELKKTGRVVAGGRNGKVGVGGLLLGGGKTFFTGRRGFACDDVISYEVVLADGRIIVADKDNNSDLFMALKGGSGNFGIVTNFRMNCFHCDRIWGGLRVLAKEHEGSALQLLQEFTAEAREDVDSMLLLFLAYSGTQNVPANAVTHEYSKLHPEHKITTVIEALIQVAAKDDATAYRKLRALPAMVDMCKPTTIDAIVSEYDPAPSGYYNCFFTATIKNDVRIFQKAAELHDQLVEDLKNFIPDGNFITECLFQPLPTVLGQKSKEFGGNIMGVTDLQHDGVIFTAIAIVKTKNQEAFAYPKLKAWGNAVCDYARTIENGLLNWVYMNYADKSQNPLASYGPENVKKLKDAAAKYDPEQVFQKLCPGGFKISKA